MKKVKLEMLKLNLNKMTIKLNKKVKKINLAEKNVLLKMLSSPGKIFSRLKLEKYQKYHKKDL